MSIVHRCGGKEDMKQFFKLLVCRVVVVELQLVGIQPWQMIPLFVIVGMEKGCTTNPKYKHHN
jgi:hypothetical protein